MNEAVELEKAVIAMLDRAEVLRFPDKQDAIKECLKRMSLNDTSVALGYCHFLNIYLVCYMKQRIEAIPTCVSVTFDRQKLFDYGGPLVDMAFSDLEKQGERL